MSTPALDALATYDSLKEFHTGDIVSVNFGGGKIEICEVDGCLKDWTGMMQCRLVDSDSLPYYFAQNSPRIDYATEAQKQWYNLVGEVIRRRDLREISLR